MSHSAGKITAPVTNDDVNATLGTKHTGVDAMCTDSHINIWSKYKPIKTGIINTDSQWDKANNTWKSTATWWKGADGNCGFTLYSTTTFANIISKTDGSMNGWTYTGTPTGGASSPYRISDFAGYNHNATPAVSAFTCSTKLKNRGMFSAACDIVTEGEDNVSIAHFAQELYFGVAICNVNGGVVFHGTNSTPFDGCIAFQLSGISIGIFDVVPFLCTKAITPQVGGFSQTYTFYTLPYVKKNKLTITSSMATITATGVWNNSAKTSMTISVQNSDSTAYSGAIYVRYIGHDWTSPSSVTEPNSTSLTFAAKSTKTYTFTGLSSSHAYRVQVRLVSGDLFEVPFDEEIDLEL